MCPFHPPFARTLPPPPLLPTTLPSIPDRLPSCMPSPLPPFAYPGFAGLCYDCGRCVLHTYLLAPLLRWDAHIKDCHFQRSGVSPAHKCCPDTWSGKIKRACLPVRVLCLSVYCGYDCQRQVSRMSFHFSPPPPPLFFPLQAPLLLGNQDTQLV